MTSYSIESSTDRSYFLFFDDLLFLLDFALAFSLALASSLSSASYLSYSALTSSGSFEDEFSGRPARMASISSNVAFSLTLFPLSSFAVTLTLASFEPIPRKPLDDSSRTSTSTSSLSSLRSLSASPTAVSTSTPHFSEDLIY